jgi:gamma-glutamyltranspeptidase / glutathione hydrolase
MNQESHRPTLLGTHFMAAATHFHAAQAAARIFAAGGNAIDAGVAAGLTLAVVEPHRASLGGVAPILIRTAEGTTHCIAGLGWWPRRATLEEVTRRWGGDLPEGIPRTVVPAALSAYFVALEHFGTLPFGVVSAPARELAFGGFAVYPALRAAIVAERARLAAWPSSRGVFLPGDRVPGVGELLRQTDLAHLLDLLVQAEQEAPGRGRAVGLRAAHDRFYRGGVAERLAAFSASEGGLLDAEDLAAFHAPVEDAVRIRYHDYEVLEIGPWSQGPALLQALKILEPFGAAAFVPGGAAAHHLRIEALKLAFADREAYYGDPNYVDVPIGRLLSSEYAAGRRACLDPEHAAAGLPAAGRPWPDRPASMSAIEPVAGRSDPQRADTTHVSTADARGNVFSATPSDPAFWSPLVPGLGIILSARGSQTWLRADHPSGLQPGKRPRLTPNPCIVLRDGKPVLALGTPGGDVQCQAMLQVLGAVLELGWDLQAAIEAPRAATYAAPNSFWPHGAEPDVVRAENRLGAEVLADLRRRGHRIEEWPAWDPLAGAVCAVQFKENGLLAGGADPRRNSYAIGW